MQPKTGLELISEQDCSTSKKRINPYIKDNSKFRVNVSNILRLYVKRNLLGKPSKKFIFDSPIETNFLYILYFVP